MLPRLLILIVLLIGSLATQAGDRLFRFDGKVYTPERLSTRMNQLYGSMLTEHYSALKTLIDEMVFDVYVEKQAAKLGKPVQEVGFGLLRVDEPGEDELQAFYQQNQQRIGLPFEEVKDRLAGLLKRQAMASKREELIARIKSEGGFELLASPPPLPAVAIDLRGRPFKGNPDAPITLVEFADYQCPNCQRAAVLIDALMKQHPGMLKVYYMDFPINSSGVSRKVAVGGMCAMAQGRFWPYHDLAFSQQDSLNEASPMALAGSLELNLDAFRACLAEPTTRARVERAFDEGRRLGITATPTLFVDGKPFVSDHLVRDLGAYIRRHQARSGGG